MTTPPLIKDKTRVQMDSEHFYGITNLNNLNDKTIEKFYNHSFSYEAKYVLKAVESMLNISPDGVTIVLPKDTLMPLLVIGDNDEEPVYIVAPIDYEEKKGE